MKEINLTILTPDHNVFTGKVSRVQLPGSEGSFEILPGHAALISTLDKGKIRYRLDNKDFFVESGSGVIEVSKDNVIVLVEAAVTNTAE